MLNLLSLALLTGQLSTLEARVSRHPNAANVHALAFAYVDEGQFQKASQAFSRDAELYARLGDVNAAKLLRELGNRYQTAISLYVQRPSPVLTSATELAKFEPITGCYLGANIEREDATRYPQGFNNLVGKHHAIFFMYRRFGVGFPVEYARELRKAKCALQLAFEPSNLYEVTDGRYLRRFAQDAARSGIPIFLRYASEMNGDWTPYHADPGLYVQKFRLIAQVMREEAPNVAMVWCPNEIPEAPIPTYFPGDDFVDWVGVNFYSVIYNDADRSRGAEWRHPEDALDFIYRKYSGRHPIMVGEWAASHRSTVDNRERPDFASAKIAQFYAAIPRIYPRVKAVSWLSFNSFKYAVPGRQLNNYSLFDNQAVADSYTQAVSTPYYLDTVSEGSTSASRPVLVDGTTRFKSDDLVSAYIRTYENAPKVSFKIDGEVCAKFEQPGPYEFHLPRNLKNGKHVLQILVNDHLGRTASKRQIAIDVS